jgi:hypothetical protein
VTPVSFNGPGLPATLGKPKEKGLHETAPFPEGSKKR